MRSSIITSCYTLWGYYKKKHSYNNVFLLFYNWLLLATNIIISILYNIPMVYISVFVKLIVLYTIKSLKCIVIRYIIYIQGGTSSILIPFLFFNNNTVI